MPDIWMDVDAALSEVPVNKVPLIDDTDFKTREESVTYDQAGMDLVWNFVTSAGAFTQTAVTPTTAGVYDWTNQGNGMYTIEIPASGGGSINNDTEGYGWFTGYATGILPWTGPVIGFRASGLNDLLCDSAYSATRGLAGTALPAAAADAAGGLPISDAGGLDMDAVASELAKVPKSDGAVSWNATALAAINAEADTALSDYDGPTNAEMTAGFAALNDPTAAEIRAEIDTNSTQLAAIKAKTDNLPSDPADESLIIAATDAIAAVLGTPAGADLAADIAAVQADTDDIQTRLPAALVSGRMSSDAEAISGSTGAADNLELSAGTIVAGTATGTPTTTTMAASGLSESTNDHYNGRIIIWTSGALQNQATDITDYDGATKTFTFTAVTEAASAGDTFVIV